MSWGGCRGGRWRDPAESKIARIKTYDEVIHEHDPEAKYADTKGDICYKQTIGLLQRRHIRIDRLHHIGKESNRTGRG